MNIPLDKKSYCSLFLISCLAVILASCVSVPEPTVSSTRKASPSSSGVVSPTATFVPVAWGDLPGWQEDDLTAAWPAWQRSCQGLARRNPSGINWKPACAATSQVNANDAQSIRRYFERHMKVMEIRHSSGASAGGVHGLVTGYYEPYLNGSRQKGGVYQTPIHRYPDAWRKKKPSNLPARAELIASGQLNGQEILWVDDAVAAAFMQIQGSGRVRMTDGKVIRLGFAGTNYQPFKSFAQWLLDKREITRATATMQGIQAWAKNNPRRVQEMLNANPRYVFFRELPASPDVSVGPIGSLGVSLTAERSIAVDTKALPLGAPVFLATTYPLSEKPLRRLVMAQDTGSAIIGAVRADYYWGTGDQAGESAGRMKQQGRMWILLPH
ncbi:MAG: transglycosylase [Polynucleobacter sp.]|nr:MAG: transglycosylase [Polynucleobacter sp.]